MGGSDLWSNMLLLDHGGAMGGYHIGLCPSDSLLLILYMNDRLPSTMHSKTALFTDDATVDGADKSHKRVFECINKDLDMLCDWFKPDVNSVKASKTKYMFFPQTHTGTHVIDNKEAICF